MKYFQEVTEWPDSGDINHIYYLSDDKSQMVGYIKSGTDELFKFKNPIRISTRGRKFTVIKNGEPDSVYFGKEEAKPETANKEGIPVTGSDGTVYWVTKRGNALSCTCKGFMFRRKCRHTEQVGGIK
jgi:hypothetical protein